MKDNLISIQRFKIPSPLGIWRRMSILFAGNLRISVRYPTYQGPRKARLAAALERPPLVFGVHAQLLHLTIEVGTVQSHVSRRLGHVTFGVVDLPLNKVNLKFLRRIAQR